jgi:hypothetical protein
MTSGALTLHSVVFYVPTLKQIQETLGFLAIGLSFAVGRTFNHFLTGCVFVFFDHPFDIGDRVEIYNPGSTVGTAAIVKRQSLLYTVFRRVDNFTDLQISNERLAFKRIENFSRVGINRQGLSLLVDVTTSFKDIARLRTELEDFLKSDENKRDYDPATLALSITNLYDLNKMELKIAFTHKGNWSDEKLRAARSNKFYCALLAACRKIPIHRPSVVGDGHMPMYSVLVPEEKATQAIQSQERLRETQRWDYDEARDGASARGGVVAPDIGGMSKEEVETATRRFNEERSVRRAAAVSAEEEAFTKLTKTPVPGKKSLAAALSSSVEVLQAATGLRMKSNSSGQEYSR